MGNERGRGRGIFDAFNAVRAPVNPRGERH